MNIILNNTLTSLTGLENLVSVGGSLNISYSSNLASLNKLENLTSIGGDLTITHNSQLSYCEIEAVCNYLADSSGTVIIYHNAPGCNSAMEVEAACLVGVGQLDGWTVGQLAVRVYPNPTYEIVHIEYEIENPSTVRIQVFNAVGEMVAELSDGILAKGKHRITWNVVDLPAGLYFVRLHAGKEAAGLKLIRQ
jgi:hypothetical protein